MTKFASLNRHVEVTKPKEDTITITLKQGKSGRFLQVNETEASEILKQLQELINQPREQNMEQQPKTVRYCVAPPDKAGELEKIVRAVELNTTLLNKANAQLDKIVCVLFGATPKPEKPEKPKPDANPKPLITHANDMLAAQHEEIKRLKDLVEILERL